MKNLLTNSNESESDEIIRKIELNLDRSIDKYINLLISNEVITVLIFIISILILLKRIITRYFPNLLV